MLQPTPLKKNLVPEIHSGFGECAIPDSNKVDANLGKVGNIPVVSLVALVVPSVEM